MMRSILILCSLPFTFRLILYVLRVFRVRRFLLSGITSAPIENNDESIRTCVLVLVPVLREQNVISKTLEHFCAMDLKSVDLRIMIVGTCREVKSVGATTLEIVEQWLKTASDKLPSNVRASYCEANDKDGDRASQLNWAVRRASDIGWDGWSVVGVYDADSLPSRGSIIEAVDSFRSLPNLCACQQPARFITAANAMAENDENPLLVANALYQDTWTIISELPMWINYFEAIISGRNSFRHLYLIGHGEFLSRATYEKFHFPEGEITDGIQLGYRMGLAGAMVKPLGVFCEDDVPHNLGVLIKQHKRWFGGCMNFASARKSMSINRGISQLLQTLDVLWSQVRWACASMAFVLLSAVSLWQESIVFVFLILLFVAYCYLLPIFAHKIMHTTVKVRYVDWLCLPIAILVKAIGPSLYLYEKLMLKSVQYEKVER